MAGAVLTILYLFRVFTMVFLGEPGDAVKGHHAREGSHEMVISVASLAVLALVSGLFVSAPSELAHMTATQIVRVAP